MPNDERPIQDEMTDEEQLDPEAMEPQDAGEADDESDGVAAEVQRIQDEMRSLNDRHLRLAAEFDNFRKRTDRERRELSGRAQADLVKRLLDVLDDLQRYASQDPAGSNAETLIEGAQLVEKKFRHALESAGLETIAAEGEFFNPETMEALMTVPTDKPEEDEMVAAVFQKGYRFGDVLVRPARVQVKQLGG